MARINNRTKKTKSSKKSRIRRHQFLQDTKLSARREYVEKEEETTKKVEFLQAELKHEQLLYQELREEKNKRGFLCGMNKKDFWKKGIGCGRKG